MKHYRRIRLFEYLLYVSILLVALSMPFFTGIFEYGGWGELLRTGVKMLPFVLVFMINNYLFVPCLLFTEKYLYYFLSCILLIVTITFLSNFLIDLFNFLPPSFPGGAPDRAPFPPGNMTDFPIRHHLIRNFGQAIVSFLLIGFNTGAKSFFRLSEERERQSERERQYLHTELSFLKHQISPHFFMNTLNNIHALIDIDTEKARDAIVKLSRMMRYLLYETDVQTVSLKKEIELIESYIELMRLRYDEDMLTVETEYPDVSEEIIVPSFLFLSFIENAFKHGIILNDHSLISIRFRQEDGRLSFTVSNKKSDVVSAIVEASGIGLENVQKRLILIFKDNYTLQIQTGDELDEIILNIPV
jgi:two-component sensor histidine kinase